MGKGNALSELLSLFGAREEDQFLYAHSGAAAVNQIFLSTYLDVVRETGRSHFVLSSDAPLSAHLSAARLEKLGCAKKVVVPHTRGQITPEILGEAIRARTILVSLPWANPFTGVIHPIEELAQVCKEKEVFLHVDATPVIGKLFFRFQDLGVDFLTFENSKGAGILVPKERALSPFILGERAPSGQTLENLLSLLTEEMGSLEHVCIETARLRNRLEKNIESALPDTRVLFKESERVPHLTCFSFPKVHSEALLFYLQRQGVLSALRDIDGQTHEDPTALTFSLEATTTAAEVDMWSEKICTSVKKLQTLSRDLALC